MDHILMEAVFFYIAYNQEPGKIEMRVDPCTSGTGCPARPSRHRYKLSVLIWSRNSTYSSLIAQPNAPSHSKHNLHSRYEHTQLIINGPLKHRIFQKIQVYQASVRLYVGTMKIEIRRLERWSRRIITEALSVVRCAGFSNEDNECQAGGGWTDGCRWPCLHWHDLLLQRVIDLKQTHMWSECRVSSGHCRPSIFFDW